MTINRRKLLQTLPAADLLAAAGPLAGRTVHASTSSQAVQGPDIDKFQWRAIEAMIWGMPAVNLELMRQAMLKVTQGRTNLILYWSQLLDWKCQTLTPNSDVIYLKPFFDTREVGPIVVEVPPADDGVINGTLMDAWQSPLEDVGPAGLDGGAGARAARWSVRAPVRHPVLARHSLGLRGFAGPGGRVDAGLPRPESLRGTSAACCSRTSSSRHGGWAEASSG